MEQPPYRAYSAIMGTFMGGLALAGALGRALDRNRQSRAKPGSAYPSRSPALPSPRQRRDPREHHWLDLATLSAATFKASKASRTM